MQVNERYWKVVEWIRLPSGVNNIVKHYPDVDYNPLDVLDKVRGIVNDLVKWLTQQANLDEKDPTEVFYYASMRSVLNKIDKLGIQELLGPGRSPQDDAKIEVERFIYDGFKEVLAIYGNPKNRSSKLADKMADKIKEIVTRIQDYKERSPPNAPMSNRDHSPGNALKSPMDGVGDGKGDEPDKKEAGTCTKYPGSGCYLVEGIKYPDCYGSEDCRFEGEGP
jgi:hypothetical protein